MITALLLHKARSAAVYLWRTPNVWYSRYKLKKAGFVVRKTGGKLHCLYRIGEEEPLSKCNRYGVPVKETLLMGANAMSRAYSK